MKDTLEEYFITIIGEGEAAQRLPSGLWVGSLTHFNILKGYWVKMSENIEFQWDYNEEQLIRTNKNHKKNRESLDFEEFKYNQSTQQAFYFFKNITINNEILNNDDWIIAYNGDNVVGVA